MTPRGRPLTQARVKQWAGAPGIIAPGPLAKSASASGVLSGDPARIAGTDRRPLLTSRRANGCSFASSSTASRNTRDTWLFGVMKSVARVELRMFSSAGVAFRVNLFGFAVGEFDFARAFQRPGRGWIFQFNLAPGF